MSVSDKARRLVDAQLVARALVKELAPACLRIEIAGSIRRERPWISDIEIVAIPQLEYSPPPPPPPQVGLFAAPAPPEPPRQINLLWERIEQVSEAHQRIIPLKPGTTGEEFDTNWTSKRVAGSKYFKLWLPRAGFKVDLFMADRDTWGVIFTIRTGSADFSKALVTRWTEVSGGGHSTGGLLLGADGRPVPTPEEEDVFLHCRAEWIPPSRRLDASILRSL